MDIYDIAALGVSVLAFIVSLLAHRLARRAFERDRSDLQLGLEFVPKSGLGAALKVTLTNHGRRRVTVREVGLILKSGVRVSYTELSARNANLPPILPVALEETETSEFEFPLHMIEESVSPPLEIGRAEASDTLGNQYSFPAGNMKSQIDFLKLKREIRRHYALPGNAGH